jgi:putative endonuclease
MRERHPAVYILASRRNGTLYVGVTSDLIGLVSMHKQHLIDGFTKRYMVTTLVYVEWLDTMPDAIRREKQIKKLGRAAKIAMIEADNLLWRDLYWELSGDLPEHYP